MHGVTVLFMFVAIAACGSAYECFGSNAAGLEEIRNRKVCHYTTYI